VSALLDRMGVSKPQGGLEEGMDAVGRALAGGGATIKAAGAVPGVIAETLAAAPGMQAASTATGTAAGEVARQMDAPPLVQAGVTLAAGSAVPAAQMAGAGATRTLLRGAGDDAAATRKALADLNADIPDAPELSKWFKNAKIQGIEGAVEKDAAAVPPKNILSRILGPDENPLVVGQTPGQAAGVPYEALKKLRTL